MRSDTEKKLRSELKIYKEAYRRLYKKTMQMVEIATDDEYDDVKFRKAYVAKNKEVFRMIDTIERYKSQKEAA